MLTWLKSIYKKEMFSPTVLGLFINPNYFARQGLHKHIMQLLPALTGEILDVGCGSKPYEKFLNCISYVGLEIDSPATRAKSQADYFYDGTTFPFNEQAFDSVMTNQVIEHVSDADLFLDEIHRVLKEDGKLLLTVPFIWALHEQPHDHRRFTIFGIKALLEKHGFEVLELRKSVNNLSIFPQLFNVYVYGKFQAATHSAVGQLLLSLVLAPINIIGLIGLILPTNEDLYLDNIVLARKVPKKY